MNADAFRQLYEYHFAENRKIWDAHIAPLTPEQFAQPVEYSLGSVRNHVIHLMCVDRSWFTELQGKDIPDWPNPDDFADAAAIRAYWDDVEHMMRGFLTGLTDEMLFQRPIIDEEDKNLITWQVLLHVVNHATDHRAQVLRILHDLGVKTGPQDFIFHAYENS